MIRTGFGYDSHRFAGNRKLILGGTEIPHEKGLLAHSDGDALCHAIMDAVIGALGMGDIGRHFPDNDPKWKDASSVILLKAVIEMCRSGGYEISWLDTTVVTEKPRLAPYIEKMKEAISSAGIPYSCINIKAKTNEGMGFVGSGEGLAAFAVCTLAKI